MRSLVAIAVGATVAVGLFQLGAIVALLVFVGLPLGAPGGPPSAGYYALNLSLVGSGPRVPPNPKAKET